MNMLNETWQKIVRKLNKILLPVVEKIGPRYVYISIFDYVLQYPNKAKFLSLGMEDGLYTIAKCYCPNGVYEFDSELIKKDITLFDWLVLLQDVTCYYDLDVILTSDRHALHEIKDYTAISRYGDYSYGLVCDRDEYCKVHKKEVVEIKEAFYLDGLWSWNWYHFVMQVLPKIKYIVSIPKQVPLLVGWHVEGNNNFHIVLNLFLERLGDSNRKIIFLSDRCAYKVERLYVASSQGLLIPDVKKKIYSGTYPNWCLYKKSTISFLRDVLLSSMDTKKKYPPNIYITRKNASGRRKFNEEEIIDLVKSKGFDIVAPEEYTVAEQVALFNNAKNIVACSGAALTNLICCQETCKIVIINNYNSTLGIFNTIASFVGAVSISVSGFDFEMGKTNDGQNAFIIEPSKLENAMLQMEMF